MADDVTVTNPATGKATPTAAAEAPANPTGGTDVGAQAPTGTGAAAPVDGPPNVPDASDVVPPDPKAAPGQPGFSVAHGELGVQG